MRLLILTRYTLKENGEKMEIKIKDGLGEKLI